MNFIGKKALLISCFDWYDNRLKYIERYLYSLGYKVKIVLSDFDHVKKSYILKYRDIDNILYIHVPRYNKNISIQRLLSHRKFSVEVSKLLEKEKPDFVYCLVPPNLLVKRIVDLKRGNDFKLVFDIIDLWPESFPKGNTNLLPFSIWRRLRDASLNAADKIVLECEYYKDILNNVSEKKLEILRLIGEPLDEISEHEAFREDVCLGYLGSINSLIDIDKICELVKAIRTSKTVLVRIVGDGERKTHFINELKAVGAVVKYYGKIYDNSKLQYVLGNCHFGINIYKENVSIGLTMKSLSYFQIGIPILNSISGDTEKIVKEYGVGLNLGEMNFSEINSYLEDFKMNHNRVKYLFNKEFSVANIESKLKFIQNV